MWWLYRQEDSTLTLLPLDGGGPAMVVEASPPAIGEAGSRLTLALPGGTAERVVAVPVPGLRSPWLAIAAPAAAASEADELANRVAHDIRNLILAIGLQAELGVLHPTQGGAGQRLEAILRQVDAVKAYLERLLRYTRPLHLEPRSIDVRSFLVDQAAAAEDAAGRTADLVAADGLGRASWDVAALGAALAELLDNAWKSADPAPRVEVRATGTPSGVTIEIADLGPGIPAAELGRLETPMAVRRAGAVGVGLATARKVIAAHGGRLTLLSSPSGTTARVELPREAPVV